MLWGLTHHVLLTYTQLKCLAARTGMEMLFIAVKSDTNQFQIPQYFVTNKASKYLVNKLGMDIDTMANKVEVQVLSMTDGECSSPL